MQISIITVVKDSFSEMGKTINSIATQRRDYNSDLEWIVIDGDSTDGTLELIENNFHIIDKFVSEKDSGIYDAMNKGLSLASGDGVLFLNAGDLLEGDVLSGVSQAPIFLPVYYHDILGRFRRVKIRSSLECLPNCHQGIIFPRTDIKYSLVYKICSDYDYFLRHDFGKEIPLHCPKGFVYFSPGVSSINYQMRDRENFLIRRLHFGLISSFVYEWRSFLKRIIRRLLIR